MTFRPFFIWIIRSLLLLTLLFVGACASIYPYKKSSELETRTPGPTPQLIDDNFGYTKILPKMYVTSRSGFGEGGEKVKFYITVNGDKIGRATYFLSRSLPLTSCNKLVVVLPIYDSKHAYPQKSLATTFLSKKEKDTNVLIVSDDSSPVDWDALKSSQTKEALYGELHRTSNEIQKRIIVIRRFLDWAETRSEICKNRIGIVGFSIGVPFAVDAMGADKRISVGALVMGGGGLQDILAFGEARDVKTTRGTILKRFKWTPEEFARAIAPIFHEVNPETYAGNIDPRVVLEIDAMHDDYIPPHAVKRLWEALGKPKRVLLPFSHKFAFLSMTWLGLKYTNMTISSFFQEIL